MIKLGFILVAVCVACLSFGACSQTMGPTAYGQAHPSDSGGGYWNGHPSNIYTPKCKGDYAACAYNSAKHHEDGNPN